MSTKALVKIAHRQGWRTSMRKSGHVVFYAPNGVDMVTVGGSPSPSSWGNTRSHLRAAGLTLA